MKILSVDSTESREKQKKSSSKILIGFDLRTSDFPVLHSNPAQDHHALSITDN